MGNTPNAQTRVFMRSVLGRKGIASVSDMLSEDTPPEHHVFQRTVEAHIGRADGGRMS